MGRASQYWLLIGACLTPKEKKNSLNAIMSNSYKNQTNIFFPHNFHFKGSQLLCNSRQREKCSSNLKPWLTPQTKIWLFGPDPGIFRCETVGCDSLAGTRLVLSSNNLPPHPVTALSHVKQGKSGNFSCATSVRRIFSESCLIFYLLER